MQKTKLIGIMWFVMSLVISCLNDVLTKKLGQRLPSFEVVFFRFLFSTISLLPFIMFYGFKSLGSINPKLHFFRGLFLFVAIAFWCKALETTPIMTVTTMSYTIPFFVLPMARIFLGEKLNTARVIATITGFVGILIVTSPKNIGGIGSATYYLVAGAMLFASLDIINKKISLEETMLSMLFYSAIVTTVLSSVPAMKVWVAPEITELFWCFLLGCGANLILYCLLKAFKYIEVSAISPFRYLELILSSIFGYLIFNDKITMNLLIGAVIIILSSLALSYFETKEKLN